MLHLSSAAQQKNNVRSKKSSSRLNTKRKAGQGFYDQTLEHMLFGARKQPEFGLSYAIDRTAGVLGTSRRTVQRSLRRHERNDKILIVANASDEKLSPKTQLPNRVITLIKPLTQELKDFFKKGHFIEGARYQVSGFKIPGLHTFSPAEINKILEGYTDLQGVTVTPHELHHYTDYIYTTKSSPLMGVVGGAENPLAGLGGEKFLFEDLIETSTHNPTPRIPRRKAASTPPKGRATPKAPQNRQKGTAKRRKAPIRTNDTSKKPKRNSVPKIKREAIAQALGIYKTHCGEISRSMKDKLERKFLASGLTCEQLVNRMGEMCGDYLMRLTTTSPLRVLHYEPLKRSSDFVQSKFEKQLPLARSQGIRTAARACLDDIAIRRWFMEIDKDTMYGLICEALHHRMTYGTWKVI